MAAVGIARQRVERHGKHQAGRCHIQLLTELLHLGKIERAGHLGDMAVRLAGREVVGQLCAAFALLHHFGKISLGLLICLTAFGLPLLLRELQET